VRISLKAILDFLLPAAVACWIALELFAAFYGPSSFRTLQEKQRQVVALRVETDALQSRLDALARRADMLHSSHLDAELLDERVRAVLGFAAPGEIVIPIDQYEAAIAASGKQESARSAK